MSGWFFDDKKSNLDKNINRDKDSIQNKDTQWNVYDTKMDYVGKVTGFLENWVKEMRKDIKKL